MTANRRICYPLLLVCCAALVAGAAGCGDSYAQPTVDDAMVTALREGGGGGGGEQAAAVTGTGWGTLRGRFVLDGQPPASTPLSTGGKDGQVCGDSVVNESIMVAEGGLANVVLYARKVTRVHDSFEAMLAETAVFDQKQCRFLDHVKIVYAGQPVQVKNSDPVAHNTNCSASGDTSFNNQIPGNGSFEVKFKKAQSQPVPVTCTIHPWMKAYIMPRKDPYVARTNPDGTFEIANLPAGEDVEFQVWHERAAAANGSISGAGADVKIAGNGRFKVKVSEDGEVDLGEIMVPASVLK